MNEKQTKHYAKMAKQFQPKSNKPVNRDLLKAFREGFEAKRKAVKAEISKRKKVIKRKKAIKRNSVKIR